MSTKIVKTQAELNQAIADKVDWIEIRSAAGVWLEVRACDSSTVRASSLVAIHLHNSAVHVSGGVILDHTKAEEMGGAAWCQYHGVDVSVHGVPAQYPAEAKA